MNERLAKLDEALSKLEGGTLDKQSLDNAVEIAREIYEQWIILKYEFQEEETAIIDSFMELKTPAKNTPKEKISIVEEDAIELKENEDNENQTTLIDIIEEIQEDITINQRISQGKTKETISQKHAKKAIVDIEKSIGINQRFSFIKNLFENDKEAYYLAVKKLNSCASFLEADDYIHNELKTKYNWDQDTVHVIKFIDIIERRYLPH
jgi:hypothetical protein